MAFITNIWVAARVMVGPYAINIIGKVQKINIFTSA